MIRYEHLTLRAQRIFHILFICAVLALGFAANSWMVAYREATADLLAARSALRECIRLDAQQTTLTPTLRRSK